MFFIEQYQIYSFCFFILFLMSYMDLDFLFILSHNSVIASKSQRILLFLIFLSKDYIDNQTFALNKAYISVSVFEIKKITETFMEIIKTSNSTTRLIKNTIQIIPKFKYGSSIAKISGIMILNEKKIIYILNRFNLIPISNYFHTNINILFKKFHENYSDFNEYNPILIPIEVIDKKKRIKDFFFVRLFKCLNDFAMCAFLIIQGRKIVVFNNFHLDFVPQLVNFFSKLQIKKVDQFFKDLHLIFSNSIDSYKKYTSVFFKNSNIKNALNIEFSKHFLKKKLFFQQKMSISENKFSIDFFNENSEFKGIYLNDFYSLFRKKKKNFVAIWSTSQIRTVLSECIVFILKPHSKIPLYFRKIFHSNISKENFLINKLIFSYKLFLEHLFLSRSLILRYKKIHCSIKKQSTFYIFNNIFKEGILFSCIKRYSIDACTIEFFNLERKMNMSNEFLDTYLVSQKKRHLLYLFQNYSAETLICKRLLKKLTYYFRFDDIIFLFYYSINMETLTSFLILYVICFHELINKGFTYSIYNISFSIELMLNCCHTLIIISSKMGIFLNFLYKKSKKYFLEWTDTT
nr:hypothetical protein 1634Bnrm1_p012 [Cryptomonas sp.]